MSSRDGLFRRGETWYASYVTPDGRRARVSTGKRYYSEAKAERNRIVGELAHGRPVVLPRKVTLDQLGELIEADYTMRGQRSLKRVRLALKPLQVHFGKRPVASITWGDTLEYRQQRVGAGLAPASINYELAILRRMLRLGVKDGKLIAVPPIETPNPDNARQGTFEREDFEKVTAKLPEAHAAVARFAYCTGWRLRSEVLRLTWPQVDFETGEVTLAAGTTKNGKPRTFTFDVLPELADLLKARRAATDAVIRESGRRVPFVFHEAGRPLTYKRFLKAWHIACEAADVPGRIPHDFRRTAARNLRRAGVDEGTIMRLLGWTTRAMFDRYDIHDTSDLRAGVAKLAFVPNTSHPGVGDNVSQ